MKTFGIQNKQKAMDEYDKTILKAELSKGIPCELKHERTGDSSFLAVDYIIQDIGYFGQPKYSVTIPICQECVDALANSNMILLYCLRCTHNQWIIKPMGKLNYGGKSICWMSCCPDCAKGGEKASVFFTD